MTPLEVAVNEAARAYCKQSSATPFEELTPFQKFHVIEYVTSLVAPAIRAYEEAKREHDPA